MQRILFPLAAVLLLATTLPAQSPPATPVFGADVEMVAVDVAVVDANGRPVRGLGPEDFKLEVDGKPRQVISADFFAVGADDVASPPPVTHGYSTNEGTAAGRAVVLVFDTGAMSVGTGRGAVAAADKLLDRLTPADRVALVTIPARGGPQVDFTADHQLVREALSSVIGRSRTLQPRKRLSLTEALAYEDETFEWENAVERECPISMNERERVICLQDIQEEARSVSIGIRQQARESMSGLRALFRGLTRIEGRKTVVLVTEGLVSEPGGEMRELAREAGASASTLYVLKVENRVGDASQDRPARDSVEEDFVLGGGLADLAAATKGAAFRLTGHGDLVFDRIAHEISGYYLLGFAPAEGDRDGAVHEIKATVTRKGATVRTRSAVAIPTAVIGADRQRDLLAAALQSPVPAVEVPVRVATWALPSADGKVRLVIAADVGAPGASAAGMTVGWVLLSNKGKVVGSAAQRAEQDAPPAVGMQGVPFFSTTLVEPALYTLRLAVVDARGRRGTVEHAVAAALTTGGGVTTGDLLLAPVPSTTTLPLRPALEVTATRGVMGWLEVGAPTEVLNQTTALAEVADRETGPALLTVPAQLTKSASGQRAFQAAIGTHLLPPGEYVMRMVVKAGQTPAVSVSHTFRTEPQPAVAGAPVIGADDVRSLLRFRRQDVVTPEVARALLAAAPAVAVDPLRKGIEQLGRNALPEALASFRTASRLAPGDAAGVFLTGVTLAADGRDREAIGAWQVARTKDLPTAGAHAALGDALLRVGQTSAAEEVLREGLARFSGNPRLERSLALAAAISGRREEARALLTRAVERDPSDVELGFVLVRLLFEETRTGGLAGARDELIKQAAVYIDAKGQHAALVAAWLKELEQGS